MLSFAPISEVFNIIFFSFFWLKVVQAKHKWVIERHILEQRKRKSLAHFTGDVRHIRTYNQSLAKRLSRQNYAH